MRASTLLTVITALLLAVTIAPIAVADSTTHVSPQRVTQGDGANLRSATDPATSQSAAPTSSATNAEAAMRAAVGKAKSEPTVTTATVLVTTTTGFKWGDAGIGAAAATGAIFLIIGLLLLTRIGRRHTPTSNALRSA